MPARTQTRRRPRFATMLTIALLCGSQPAIAQQTDPLAPTGTWSANVDGAAITPPMGWNSWNAFFTDLDEEKVLASAQVIVDTGLAAKGYRYINLDEGWWQHRRDDGRMLANTDRFPSTRTPDGATSFRPFTDRLHGMGLKAGLYSDLGRNTCAQAYMPDQTNLPRGTLTQREVGLYGHIDQDISQFFGEWGFDYIKIDGCGLRAYGPESERVVSGRYRALDPILNLETVALSDIPAVRGLFGEVKTALMRYNPDNDFVLSLCIWGSAHVRAWAKDIGNVSRTSDDITPHWGRMLTNFDTAVTRELYAHPGSWNDPDMLFIGKGDFDADHLTEARSHFTLWAFLNAPLLIGSDLRNTPQPLMDIFGNSALIALNQDPGGHQAVLAYDTDDLQILVKTLADGDKAVAILNRSSAPVEATLTAAHMKLRDDAAIATTDLWNGEGASFTGEMKVTVAPRETRAWRVRGNRALEDGMYLSELPGQVNPAVDGLTVPQVDPTIHRAASFGTRGSGARPFYTGWGGARADSTPYGRVLQVAGQHFASGIGVLANSRLEARNEGHRRFTASVGVDDSAEDADNEVTFALYGDGRLLTRSEPLSRGMPAQSLEADITGVTLLELVARTRDAANGRLPVTWGDAALMQR
ncbi:NPCBM/NEW2 domain-containing protein [Croceibacterium mercuriale]